MIRLKKDMIFKEPEARIREYCEIEVYQGYDDRHNVNDTISHEDIDAANNLYAMINRYDNTESERLLSCSKKISEALYKVPNLDIFAIPDKEWSDVKCNIESTLERFLSVHGIGLAKATKILHLKRPNLFPVLDSFVVKFLLGIDITSAEKNRQLEIGLEAIELIRAAIAEQREAFDELVKRTSDLQFPLTPVRMFDILCWTTEKWDMRKKHSAPYGTPHKSLLDLQHGRSAESGSWGVSEPQSSRVIPHFYKNGSNNPSCRGTNVLKHDLVEIRKAVLEWKNRRNQRYEVLKLLVNTKNDWLTGAVLRRYLPGIKDPTTVLYDMALRNPADTPRGRGYYDRLKVYPLGSGAEPILEYNENLGYRIRPEYLEAVSQIL